MNMVHLIELIVLFLSVVAAVLIVRRSNQKVDDLDGLGPITQKGDCKGEVVAQI